MPGILKSRKFLLLIFFIICIGIASFFSSPWVWMGLLIAFFLATVFLFFNKLIIHKLQKNRLNLSSQRNIKKIRTLIIGDKVSEKSLSRLNYPVPSLCFLNEGKSLESSKLLLYHLSGVLEENGKAIVIIPAKEKNNDFYDSYYWSLTTNLEKGINPFKISRVLPLLFHPVQSLKLFKKEVDKQLKEIPCPDEELKSYCRRKRIELVCLDF